MRIGIIGAGMSGLSLAVHLLKNSNIQKIVLIEPRSAYVRDKTWCYFKLHAHPFEELIKHRWSCFEINTEHSRKRLHSAYPYEMVQSDDFYRHAVALLSDDLRVDLRLGSSVSALKQNQDSANWHYQSSIESFDYIFDSRPSTDTHTGWRQVFAGGVVCMPQEVFDTQCATLMDFSSASDKVKFHYLLPIDPQRALIQETWFVSEHTPTATPSKTALEHYLQSHFSAAPSQWEYEECGNIPMQPRPKGSFTNEAGRILPIGGAAGWIRGATGYSFLETQRACESIAAQLAQSKKPNTAPSRPAISETLDAIFLRALAMHFETAPNIFRTLFENADTLSVLRFLGGTGTTFDHIELIAACPKLRFIKAAAKHVFS
jgi:lycopene beta-cyclase